jgi:hypothetical protein
MVRRLMGLSWALKQAKHLAWDMDNLDDVIVCTHHGRPVLEIRHLSDETIAWYKQHNTNADGTAFNDTRWQFFLDMRGKSNSTPEPQPAVEQPTSREPTPEEIAEYEARMAQYDREAKEARQWTDHCKANDLCEGCGGPYGKCPHTTRPGYEWISATRTWRRLDNSTE